MKVTLLLWTLSAALLSGEGLQGKWETPTVGEGNLAEWQRFIQPSGPELAWQNIRWHRELEFAAEEARELGRPILLWTMNGHPAGET